MNDFAKLCPNSIIADYYLGHLFHRKGEKPNIRKYFLVKWFNYDTIHKQCPFTIHVRVNPKNKYNDRPKWTFSQMSIYFNESKCNSKRDKCVFDVRRRFSFELFILCTLSIILLLLLLLSKKGEIDLIFQMIAINWLLNSIFGNKWWWWWLHITQQMDLIDKDNMFVNNSEIKIEK